jgi:hypothetical protein
VYLPCGDGLKYNHSKQCRNGGRSFDLYRKILEFNRFVGKSRTCHAYNSLMLFCHPGPDWHSSDHWNTANRFSIDSRKCAKFLHTGKPESFQSMKLMYLPQLYSFEMETMTIVTMLAAVQSNLCAEGSNLLPDICCQSIISNQQRLCAGGTHFPNNLSASVAVERVIFLSLSLKFFTVLNPLAKQTWSTRKSLEWSEMYVAWRLLCIT